MEALLSAPSGDLESIRRLIQLHICDKLSLIDFSPPLFPPHVLAADLEHPQPIRGSGNPISSSSNRRQHSHALRSAGRRPKALGQASRDLSTSLPLSTSTLSPTPTPARQQSLTNALSGKSFRFPLSSNRNG